MEALKKEIEELKQQLEKTYDLLEKGLYSEDIFIQRNKKISTAIKEKETRLEDFNQTLNTILNYEKQRTVWIPETMALIDSYSTSDSPELRNTLLRQLVEKVTYLKTEKNHRGTVDNRNFQLKITPKLPRMSESDL